MAPVFSDNCLAFQIEGQDIKGRIIRLDQTLNEVLNKHHYPDDIKRELGQAMAITALLGSMMKFEGILTFQLQSTGVIQNMVSDFAKENEGGGSSGSGVVRGYCGMAKDIAPDTPALGDGKLVITIDQGQYMDRYQGIVKLKDNSLKESVKEYFHTSEQLPSQLMVSCDKGPDGRWQAAALMIQHLARSSKDELATAHDEVQRQDHWNTASVLLTTLKSAELLDGNLSLQDILMRLYHEAGVRVFTTTEMTTGCRCSEKKLRTVLTSFSVEELTDIAVDGIITMTCEFCMTDHKFELKKLIN